MADVVAASATNARRRRVDRRIVVGGSVLAVLVALSVLAPLLPFGSPTQIAAGPRLAPPSWTLPFGADQLGRSNLPRVLLAIQSTFVLSALAVTTTLLIATPLGLLAAYFRGAVDQLVMRFGDVLFALPPLLLALLIAAILGPGSLASVVAILIISLPLFQRVIRSVGLSIAQRDFVTLARLSGASPLRIVIVHLLPNVAGPVVVQFAYSLSVGMLVESALSFLGLGVQPPGASLGSLLYTGSPFIALAPWLVFFPGTVLAVIVVCVNMLADGLQDMFDPLRERTLI